MTLQIIILMLASIAMVTTIISITSAMRMITISKKVNTIISNHNDMMHTLEEDNRLLQNKILMMPNDLIISIENIIKNCPDCTVDQLLKIIKNIIKNI